MAISEDPDVISLIEEVSLEQSTENKKFQEMRTFFTEERARALAENSNFREAAAMLSRLRPDNENDLGAKLVLAECHLYLGNDEKAMLTVADIRKMIMKPPMCDIDDVIGLADAFVGLSPIRAVILYRIATHIIQFHAESDNEIVDNIYRCITKAEICVNAMIMSTRPDFTTKEGVTKFMNKYGSIFDPSKPTPDQEKMLQKKKAIDEKDRMHIIAKEFGIEYLVEMFQDLCDIDDADPDKKAMKVAWSSNMVGYEYAFFGETQKGIDILQIGIKALEEQFGKQVKRHRIYGVMLHNLGLGYFTLGEYEKAEPAYKKSLDAKEAAIDYPSEQARENDILISSQDLKDTRIELGKI